MAERYGTAAGGPAPKLVAAPNGPETVTVRIPTYADGNGDLVVTAPKVVPVTRKWVLIDGRYHLNPLFTPPWWDVGLGGAIVLPPLIAAGARFGPGAIGIARFRGEIPIGNHMRIAPFGNRFKHQVGRFPHYHRRPSFEPPKGQGLGRHRPWEKKESDTSFWDRF